MKRNIGKVRAMEQRSREKYLARLRERPRTRIRPVSRKRAAENRERAKLLKKVVHGKPCAVRWDDDCRGMATDGHELLSRARGGSIVARENVVPACRPCHTALTDNPAEAARRGWALSAFGDAA